MFAPNPPFCQPCGKTFHTNQQLIIHNNQVHPVSQPLLKIRKDLLDTLTNTHLNFDCEWCQQTFNRKGELQIHVQVEHGQKVEEVNRKCQHCGKNSKISDLKTGMLKKNCGYIFPKIDISALFRSKIHQIVL